MSTIANRYVICGACQHEFGYSFLRSVCIFYGPDLDSRLGEMARSTMSDWIVRCPSCSYCAPDIEKFDERSRVVLQSPEYSSQLSDTVYPETAAKFICSGMLADAAEKFDDAGWAYLRTAWVFDDANNDSLASEWRSKAADRFLTFIATGELSKEKPGTFETIAIDCLRRSGRGDEALQLIEKSLNQNYEDTIRKIVSFQKTLIERGDTSLHLASEALEKS